MNIADFLDGLKRIGVGFYTGVPDSKLKALCDVLSERYGTDTAEHRIATNEGTAAALAAGYHLSSGKIGCVYLQNSGLGNIINPIASLLSEEVYGIPCVFVIGWRGEPNLHDEPQHIFQGKVTLDLLRVMDIPYQVLDKELSCEAFREALERFRESLEKGKSVAFVIKADALSYESTVKYENPYSVRREEILEILVDEVESDIFVATTGKTSRELFEIRERKGQAHKQDFLTVGSMGHSSSIALQIALEKPAKKVWCIDGDGAVLMHMGAMALIGSSKAENFIHLVINNQAHESVGGQPTIGDRIDLLKIAEGCGYSRVYRLQSKEDIREVFGKIAKEKGPVFIEIKSAIGSRKDLGRPTQSAKENKKQLMNYLKECM